MKQALPGAYLVRSEREAQLVRYGHGEAGALYYVHLCPFAAFQSFEADPIDGLLEVDRLKCALCYI